MKRAILPCILLGLWSSLSLWRTGEQLTTWAHRRHRRRSGGLGSGGAGQAGGAGTGTTGTWIGGRGRGADGRRFRRSWFGRNDRQRRTWPDRQPAVAAAQRARRATGGNRGSGCRRRRAAPGAAAPWARDRRRHGRQWRHRDRRRGRQAGAAGAGDGGEQRSARRLRHRARHAQRHAKDAQGPLLPVPGLREPRLGGAGREQRRQRDELHLREHRQVSGHPRVRRQQQHGAHPVRRAREAKNDPACSVTTWESWTATATRAPR